jgi:hypothetical protein
VTRVFQLAEFNQGIALVVVECRPCRVVEYQTGRARMPGQYPWRMIGRIGGAACLIGEDLGTRACT